MNSKYAIPRWVNGKRTQAGKEFDTKRKKEKRVPKPIKTYSFLEAIPEIVAVTTKTEDEVREMYVYFISQFDRSPRVTVEELAELKRVDKIPNDLLRDKLNKTNSKRIEMCAGQIYTDRPVERLHNELGVTQAKCFIDYDQAVKITKAFDWEPHETGC